MSWFTEFAGKAEDLLNRVDQSAATALQNKNKTPTHEQKPNTKVFSSETYIPSQIYSAPLGSQTSNLPPKSEKSKTIKDSKQQLENSDEQLLQFLNSNETLPSPVRKMKQKDRVSPKKYLQSSELNTDAAEYGLSNGGVNTIEDKLDSMTSVPETSLLSTEQIKNGEMFKSNDQNPVLFCESTAVSKSNDQNFIKSSYLYVENQAQAESKKTEVKSIQKKLDSWNPQLSSSDKLTRELKEREKDMIAALDAKDAQLAVLKVRLQEADQELLLKRHIAAELEAENEKLIKEHAQSAALQNKTIEALQEHVRQAETDLNRSKEALHQNQNEHMQKMAKMEEEHRSLVDSYTSLQKKWTDLNDRSKELSTQLKQSNGNFDALQQEYTDYKQKAQRILQSKEKLITSLKGGSFESDVLERSEAASALLSAEVEGVRQERDLVREELRRANELLETYRAEAQELEKAASGDAAAAQQRCDHLREQLALERTQKEEAQLMGSQLKEEFQILRDELTRSKTAFQSRLQDREIEIEKLRRQLTAKSLSTVSQDELESRLHALTENLIQKQTLVESLSTEKNSLVLQLERLDQQLREAQNYTLHQHAYVGINNNDPERKAKTVYLENPFDSAITRKVKRVYGSFDSLSIRLGVFFRRYPISRVFVFIYMLLLHFWVMIVLLTYEPEIHSASYEASKHQ